MTYKISITLGETNASSFVEGIIKNLSDVPEVERRDILMDYFGALLDQVEGEQ